MYIEKLSLENFRNYKTQTFDFCKDTNIIYGLNGQGKTNVIEAIYFFCNGKSYRSVHDSEVINFGGEYARINADFFSQNRKNSAQIYLDKKKSVKINGIPITKLSELVGLINMVIFTPDGLNLIKSGPAVRRQFLDILISQLKPLYFKTLLKYYKILAQRNNILKSGNKKMLSTIDIWNLNLAECAAVICKYRNEAIQNLNSYINLLNYENEKENIKILYSANIKGDFCDKSNIIKRLEENLERDLDKKITLCGPHRDDIEILMNGKSIKKYGSQGQIRTCVLKLKLAECEIIKDITGEQPILLLDDILSELDEKRKTFFLENIKNRQIIITSTEKEVLKGDCKYFNIQNGKVI